MVRSGKEPRGERAWREGKAAKARTASAKVACEAWPELHGLVPLPKRIDPWSPADARQRFLDAARDLFGPLALQQSEREAA